MCLRFFKFSVICLVGNYIDSKVFNFLPAKCTAMLHKGMHDLRNLLSTFYRKKHVHAISLDVTLCVTISGKQSPIFTQPKSLLTTAMKTC